MYLHGWNTLCVNVPCIQTFDLNFRFLFIPYNYFPKQLSNVRIYPHNNGCPRLFFKDIGISVEILRKAEREEIEMSIGCSLDMFYQYLQNIPWASKD